MRIMYCDYGIMVFAEDRDNPCESPSISVSQCPDVLLQRMKISDLASPCVAEPKDEL